MLLRRFAPCVPVLALVTLVSACGGAGQAGEAVRPAAVSGAQAMGESLGTSEVCSAKATNEPLVIDWKSSDRTDLELGMRDGVVVVAFDCKSLRIVKGCRVTGSYAYAGVSPKEDIVQLKSADDLAANLPLSAAKLGGEIKRGSALDLALVTIGRKSTTAAGFAKPDLEGTCDGATHYVRAAYLGAFAMGSGTSGKVRAAAELFGAGTSAASSSERNTQSRDGDLAECKKSHADAPKPPDQCQSALRIELLPIPPDRATPVKKADREGDKVRCGDGFSWSGTACVKAGESKDLAVCDSKDLPGCLASCEKGQADSCRYAGYLEKDRPNILRLFERSCALGSGSGCFAHTERLMTERMQRGVPDAEKAALLAQAMKQADRACELGDAWVCWNTSSWYENVAGGDWPKDLPKSATMARRGCDLGYAPACLTTANKLIAGEGTAKDGATAEALLKRACDAGKWENCERLAAAYSRGELGAKDAPKALAAYTRACSYGGARACHTGSLMLKSGDGVPKDVPASIALLQKGCSPDSPGWDACFALGEAYEGGAGVAKDMKLAAEVYERGCMKGGCRRAGEIWEKGSGVKADTTKALALYERACHNAGDAKGCEAQGRLLEKRDKPKALAFYADLCSRMGNAPEYQTVCDHAKKLGVKPTPFKGGLFPKH